MIGKKEARANQEEATVQKLLTFMGTQCKRGHSGERYVKSRTCVACNCIHGKTHYAANPKYSRDKHREYRQKHSGHKIYFFQEGLPQERGPVKIGYTYGRILKRLTDLQTGNPRLLFIMRVIYGTKKDEENMHKRFTPLPGRNEWFEYHELMDAIEVFDPDYIQARTHDL